jgi:hypothetical protein
MSDYCLVRACCFSFHLFCPSPRVQSRPHTLLLFYPISRRRRNPFVPIDENSELKLQGDSNDGGGRRSLYRSRDGRARSEAPPPPPTQRRTRSTTAASQSETESAAALQTTSSSSFSTNNFSSFVHRKRSQSTGGGGEVVMPTAPNGRSRELLRSYRDTRDYQPDTLSWYKTASTSWFDVPNRSHSQGVRARASWSRHTIKASTRI